MKSILLIHLCWSFFLACLKHRIKRKVQVNIMWIIFLLISPTVLCARSVNSSESFFRDEDISKKDIEQSLVIIHDIATENLGALCVSKPFWQLKVPLNAMFYEGARQKADLAVSVLKDVGINRHGGLLDALAKGLLFDEHVTSARILVINTTNSAVDSFVWWEKNKKLDNTATVEPILIKDKDVQTRKQPNVNYPWYDDENSSPGFRSPKFVVSPGNISIKGWWTYPYYSCKQRNWILSYSVVILPLVNNGYKGLLSIDIDITKLRVNQCEVPKTSFKSQYSTDFEVFYASHKCHRYSMNCEYRLPQSSAKTSSFTSEWTRGAYQCTCKRGYFSPRHPNGFNGTIMEVAYEEYKDNISMYYKEVFKCVPCAPGCEVCVNSEPCLSNYNWSFRISLLIISVGCAFSTILLGVYMFQYRRIKVFKVASPIFLLITLIGCAIMYLEMAAIFPVLDRYWCIATKWTRHMGFCITYTSLLMKTWRVSLTYRVKSAHKVKLTDKQLLQWMFPILLVMLIYLGTWTFSAPPNAEVIRDHEGLKFKQCTYNWWDHSLAIGEVMFLAWGIRVCYNVRNAESLYNEARLISFAIYNITIVNITMIAFHLFIFPRAGPDVKYLLGFIRTQLSTSVTIALVFGPKVLRVLRGQGDQWDNKTRVRSITASFSLNGVGLVPEESPDLYQENEELKEEIQKLAHQIEFMKTVHMQINNRHIKPKPGSYFTITSTSFHNPFNKNVAAQTQTSNKTSQPNSFVSEDGHSGSNSFGTNSIGYPAASIPASQINDTEKI